MSLIFTPSGGMVDTERRIVTLPPAFVAMLDVLADVASDLNLGMHCSRCQQDVVGQNAKATDERRMECGCRTFIGKTR